MTHPSGFINAIIDEIEGLRHRLIQAPVIDEWLAAVDPPVARDGAHIDRVLASLWASADRWDAFAARLDQESREKLRAVLLFRAVGFRHYRMPWASASEIGAAYAAARACIIGPAQVMPPQPYPIHRFDFDHCGQRLLLEAGLGLVAAIFVVRQYFHPQVHIQAGDVVIDGGGCFGDTAIAFAAEAGPDGRVISFEPCAANREIFKGTMSLNPILAERITLLSDALSDAHGLCLRLAPGGAGSRIATDGVERIRSAALDQLVDNGQIARVDFIKLDIEYHEANALHGARQVLERFKPRLAIAAYHHPEDLLDLSDLILSIRNDYRFYIGHVTSNQTETVLFAV